MEELKGLLKNVERIASAMERRNVLLEKIAEKDNIGQSNNSLDSENILSQNISKIDENNNDVANSNLDTVSQENTAVLNNVVGIPVSNQVETYTQDQLARAMANAIDAGKMTDIQNILSCFGVQSLVQIQTERYGELALKLREIGVEV